MKKITLYFITFVCSICLLTTNAQAVILQFDAVNGPGGIGLRLDINSQANLFSFKDVKFSVNTANGHSTLFGNIEHLISGEIWHMDAQLSQIGSHGTWNSGPVPYEEMFQELLDFATQGYDQSIYYDQSAMSLTHTGDFAAANGYTGPTNWIGKELAPPYDQDAFITYRHRLDEEFFPGSEWDVLTGSGWWQVRGRELSGSQDTYFILKNPHVPEPASLVLFGFGLAGLSRIRIRRKNCSA